MPAQHRFGMFLGAMFAWIDQYIFRGKLPFTYFNNMLPIFAAAIVGGIGNPFGAFLGGYVIAFSEIFLIEPIPIHNKISFFVF